MIPVDKKEKRGQMLNAALVVFARSGYEGATISEIASEAGVAKGAIYDYFKNKEDLFARLFESIFGKGEAAAGEDGVRSQNPVEEIAGTAGTMLKEYESMGEYFNVIAQFWARGQAEGAGGVFYTAWQDMYRSCRQSLAQAIRRGIDTGLFQQDVDVEEAAWAIVAAVDGSILQWLHMEGAGSSLVGHGMAAIEMLLRGLAVDGAEVDSFFCSNMTERPVKHSEGKH